MFFDQVQDPGPVEIPHRNDRHQIGAVPGVIKALQGFCAGRLDGFLGSDGHPLGVAGSPERRRELLGPHPFGGALAESPLLDDDPPFLVNARRVKVSPWPNPPG